MISFNVPMKFRGKHAAYAHYLSTDKGQKRVGGVNVFSRIIDAYMVSILVGLKYNRTAPMNSDAVYYKDVFDNSKEYGDKTVSSSDINGETMMASGKLLNYIYRIVMLNENVRGLNDEEKIANAFKSENDEQRLKDNIELMNSFSRGGLEILYERFQGLSGQDDEIRETQLELFDDMSGYTNESL